MTDGAVIEVGFDWQPGEHAEVIRILNRRQFRASGWRVAKWAAGFVGVGWLILAISDLVLYGTLSTFLAGVPWLIFVAFWVWLFTRGIGAATARQSSGLNVDVNYPFVQRFDEQGLRIQGFATTVELRWVGMARAEEEDGFFLFYWNSKCAYFTPKRAMSLEDQNRLRALADLKLGADAHMRERILPRTTESGSA